MAAMHPQSDLPLAGFEHTDAPYWYAHGGDLTPEAYGRQVAHQLEQRIQELGADNVAAFIGEPVQGGGGVIVPPAGYWQEIKRICRQYDVLLIADEVICGFGRTGRWWGCERFGFTPDIITAAKGLSSGYLPIAAVLVGARIGDALVEPGREWAHGFTYSGHPVAAAVALENLRILTDEGLYDRASGPLGRYFANALASLADHPLVGEVRSCGLLAAIELVEDPASRRRFAPERGVGAICRDHCLAEGLIMRPVRDTMVLAPPLVISEDEIDQIVQRAGRALERTAATLAL
jgi:putrescine aminotransferase